MKPETGLGAACSSLSRAALRLRLATSGEPRPAGYCKAQRGGARLGKAQHGGRRVACTRPAAPPICFANRFLRRRFAAPALALRRP
jgi:hypothetical protein